MVLKDLKCVSFRAHFTLRLLASIFLAAPQVSKKSLLSRLRLRIKNVNLGAKCDYVGGTQNYRRETKSATALLH